MTLPMILPSCLLAHPHAIAFDLPSILAARSRARSCSHKLSAKSLSTSGWAGQKSRQPLSFPRFSRAWWTNLNRCRKSIFQLGHVEVSTIFRERVRRRPCFLLACWSLAISEMKCFPHSQHVHGLTTGWLLTRDSSPFLSNVLSLKCKPPTRARHFFSSSAAFSQLFSHPSASRDGRDCLAIGDKAHNALMSARSGVSASVPLLCTSTLLVQDGPQRWEVVSLLHTLPRYWSLALISRHSMDGAPSRLRTSL